MRRLLSSLLAVGLLLMLSACGAPASPSSSSASSEASSQTEEASPVTTPFTLPVFPEFSLHPTLGANRANLTLSPLLYEGLFLVDERFQAVPVLCERYSFSEDKRVWTFTLRSGITFSDGTPLTGQAVAEALNLARSEQGRYANRLADVVSIEAEENSNTITITLSRPNGSLPCLLDIPISNGSGDRPTGTGPYVLASTEDGLSLVPRSGWWQGKSLPFEQIPLYSVSKSDELIYAFDTGSISLLDVDLMATNAMGYGGNYQTWDYATTDLIYLGFNTRSGLCRSAQVRLAISAAIDRFALAQTTYASHAEPCVLPVHPDSPLYSQEIAGRLGYDPDVLAEQLDSLGLAGQELRLLVNSENEAKASAAQLIAYQLDSAGLTVQVEQLSYEDYTAALTRGDFDLYLGETVLTADFDLSPLLSSSGSLNFGRWQNSETDALLSAMHTARPGDGKQQAAQALFTQLEQQMPLAPLLFKNGSVLTQWGRLTQLNPLRNNVFYQFENWNIQ